MLILDEQSSFRDLLSARLRSECLEMEILDCEPGPDPVQRCCEHMPDILILDAGFTGLSLTQIVAEVRRHLPSTRTLITVQNCASALEDAMEAIRGGAHGCVLKTESLEELTQAIDVVVKGGRHLSPRVQAAWQNPRSHALRSLSNRQREVLRLIAEGLSTKEISSALQLSVKTAGHHRLRLMKKLELHDSVSVVRFAVTTGLVRF